MKHVKLVAPLALLLVGCASDPPPADQSDDHSEDPSSDAARAEATKNTDATGGRDTSTSSCFAACQNVSLTCTSKASAKTSDVFLQLDGFKGCAGTIGSQKLAITCLADTGKAPQVCVDDQCHDGTFSAFTFAFGDSVCTRN